MCWHDWGERHDALLVEGRTLPLAREEDGKKTLGIC